MLADLGGVEIDAYEIHMGKTEVRESPLLRIQRMDSGDSVIADGTVSDDGIGFPPEHQRRIFESFYRVGEEMNRKTPGSGLGLAIVRRYLELDGGGERSFRIPEQQVRIPDSDRRNLLQRRRLGSLLRAFRHALASPLVVACAGFVGAGLVVGL